jgi:hypothetical protein
MTSCSIVYRATDLICRFAIPGISCEQEPRYDLRVFSMTLNLLASPELRSSEDHPFHPSASHCPAGCECLTSPGLPVTLRTKLRWESFPSNYPGRMSRGMTETAE